MARQSSPHFRAAQALFCLCLAACRREAGPHLERGDRLFALGQHKQAIVEYQAAQNLEPSSHAERGLGLSYEALAAFAPAERHLLAALDRKPDDVDARVALARVNTHFGRYERARSELLAALDRDPDSSSAALLLGVYAETRAQVQQAIDLIETRLERGQKLNPSSSHEAQLVLADLMARLNRGDAADKLREGVRYTPLGNTLLTLELARASGDRGNHELARRLLLPLVERHPGEIDAWQVLAQAALELGQFGEARNALEHLETRARDPEVRLLEARLGLASGLETQPTAQLRALLADLPRDDETLRARVRRFLAQALRDQHRVTEAEAELELLLSERPEDIEGTLALSELRLDRRESARAIELLSKLTDNHGRLGRAYQLLGRAQLDAGQLDSAEQSFRRVWELAPHEPEGRYWIALTLERKNQIDQARRLLEGNLKRFPEHAPSLQALLRLLERHNGTKSAKSVILAHAEQHPKSAEIACIEADWLLSHQDAERALTAYRRALVIQPSFYPAVLALSRFYARHGKSSLAHSAVDAALTHNPKSLPLLLLGAQITSDFKHYDQAREYCERALDANPDHPFALAELGRIQAEGFRDLARAAQLVEKAYSLAPARAEVLDARGWITHLRGASERALPFLEKAVAQRPDEPRLIYHLGAALLATGQTAAANVQLARVLSLDPLFPTANEIRTLLARR